METKIKWILLLHVFCNHEYVTSYFYEQNVNFQNPGHQDYDYDGMVDYPQHYPPANPRGYNNRFNRYQYDYEDCSDRIGDCSCDLCDNPTSCCIDFCNTCPGVQGLSSMVYVPYPYPIMMPIISNVSEESTDKAVSNTTTNTTESTTIHTTITSTIPETTTVIKDVTSEKSTTKGESGDIVRINEWNKIRASLRLKNGNNRPLPTSLRRMKPANWMSKYRILPIPENLADELMSQLRQVKGLNHNSEQN